jgi:hypothetical protein
VPNFILLETGGAIVLESGLGGLLAEEALPAPFDQTGLILDTEPDSFGLANGAQIVQLTNSVTGQNSGIQGAAGSRATYQAAVQNGYGAAVFDGVDDLYSSGNILSGKTQGEVFLVIKTDTDPPSNNVFSGLWATAADFSSHFPLSDGNIYDGWGSTTRRTVGDPVPNLATGYRLYNVSSSGAEHTMRLNGTQLATFAANTVAFPADWHIGRSDATTLWFQGRILRILIYSVVKTASERLSIENYLNARYLLY